MDLMLFLRNADFTRFGAIKNPELKWNRRWHKAGSFELKIPYRSGIEEGQLVSKGLECGVIDGIVLETTDNDGDQMELTGSFLAGYASRRIVWGKDTITGTPEYVMKQLVTGHMGSGAASARQFSGLTVQASQGFAGTSLNYQQEDVELEKQLNELSENSGLGYDIVLNGAGMTFRVLQGIDRSAIQSVNPRAIFSIERKNIIKAEFEQDTQKLTNVAKVKTDLYEEVVGTATGAQRREVFLKPSDVTKNESGGTNTEAQQRALMRQQGTQKLTPQVLSMTFRADPYGNLVYKTHYDLGDIITAQVKRWGVTMHARITEISEVYTSDGFGLEITVGTGQYTFDQTIRRIANV